MAGTVHCTAWVVTGTSPSTTARLLVQVAINGTSRKGMSRVGLSTSGSPNTISSLILNSTGAAASLARRRLLGCRPATRTAMTRHRQVPQPPIITKVSRKDLVYISVGVCPAASKAWLTARPFSNIRWVTASSMLLP